VKTQARIRSAMRLVVFSVAVLFLSACQRKVAIQTAPLPAEEQYCWWAVHRSPLAVDSVAQRFERAFAAVGLDSISTAKSGDTIWVVSRGSRAVVYWHGDSTHYRYYFQAVPLLDVPQKVDSKGVPVSLCERIAQAAAIPGSTPREPTGEEKLPVWTRRP
jgi:hypothetical protein